MATLPAASVNWTGWVGDSHLLCGGTHEEGDDPSLRMSRLEFMSDTSTPKCIGASEEARKPTCRSETWLPIWKVLFKFLLARKHNWMRVRPLEINSALIGCFCRFDTDRSGNISQSELQNAFRTFGYNLWVENATNWRLLDLPALHLFHTHCVHTCSHLHVVFTLVFTQLPLVTLMVVWCKWSIALCFTPVHIFSHLFTQVATVCTVGDL